MITTKAPGKLILSGEHAVVYGHPALVMAVDRYVTSTLTPRTSFDVSLDLDDLQYRQQVSFSSLNQLRLKIRSNHKCYQEKTLGVRSILETPAELILFAVSLLFEEYSFSNGINIQIKSSIPMGSGMGSSAALILSVLFAVGHHLQLNFSADAYYRLALEAENMQHGRSSGLDVLTSLKGGFLYRHKEALAQCTLPRIPMYLVNTGIPKTSTGECVTHVSSHFKNSTIGDDFAAVTKELYGLLTGDQPLTRSTYIKCQETVRVNHQLLNMIGVVPEKVACFIREVEAHGGAAKICGAGSIIGDAAGMVMVFLEDGPLLKKISLSYKYDFLPITCEPRGVYVV
jgi:mevalonate kinase